MCWQEVVRIGYYMPYLWVHESERTGICRHGECGGVLSDLSADAVVQLVVRVELIARIWARSRYRQISTFSEMDVQMEAFREGSHPCASVDDIVLLCAPNVNRLEPITPFYKSKYPQYRLFLLKYYCF